jgi:hypothetical protein
MGVYIKAGGKDRKEKSMKNIWNEMTKKRKIWLSVWAGVIVLSGMTIGSFGVILLLLVLGIIESIRFCINWSKRSKEASKASLEKAKVQTAIMDESLITTGLPPQNLPTHLTSFWQVFLVGVLLSPLGLFICMVAAKSSITKQQNRVKEARIQRGITLPPEVYVASEAYFDKRRAECSKALLPGILAWIVLAILTTVIWRNIDSDTYASGGGSENAIYASTLLIRPGVEDVGTTVGAMFYSKNVPEEITVEKPVRSKGMDLIRIKIGATHQIDVYLDFRPGEGTSLIKYIDVKNLQPGGKSQRAESFEEKYQVIGMLAGILMDL